MLPFKSLLLIDRSLERPLNHQISDGLIKLIQKGVIASGQKLPGTRILGSILKVHRQTVVVAFNELEAQGWIDIMPNKGAFVSKHLPVVKPVKIGKLNNTAEDGLQLPPRKLLNESQPPAHSSILHVFNDGFPDERLAPMDALSRAYRAALKSGQKYRHLTMFDSKAKNNTEQVLIEYLNKTRGLRANLENILITKGSQMGIYLVAASLISKADIVVIGETNYFGATYVFENFGADLIRIPVDESGIQVEELEKICKIRTIKLVYITPHHHHPTTVTLSASRRMKLYYLAEAFGFKIIEDDYDYDFHYSGSPLLPLASTDELGLVIYVGSMSKNIAPGVRFGYVVASQEILKTLKNHRELIDRRGDLPFEKAMSSLISDGTLQRHLKKSIIIYKERRNTFCSLLQSYFKKGEIEFKVPEGGLAVWVNFNSKFDLDDIAKAALKERLQVPDSQIYVSRKRNLNALRMGFASMNSDEIEQSLSIFNTVCHQKN